MAVLSANQNATLQMAMHVVSSISCVACVTVLMAVWRVPRLQTMVNYMFCCLISCDFFLSLAFSFGTIALTDELSTMCFIQGIMVQFFFIASSSWNFLISLHCYIVISSDGDVRVAKNGGRYHLFAWGSATLLTCALFIAKAILKRGEIIGNATLECWISEQYSELRLAFFYMILWVEYLVIIGLYVAVYFKIHAMAQATNDNYLGKVLSKGKSRIILKAACLAIAVAVCWIPASASRVIGWIGNENGVPFWLYLAQAITMPAHGLFDSLIFLFFAFGLKNQVGSENGESEEGGNYQNATLQMAMHVVSTISCVACITVVVIIWRVPRLQTMVNYMFCCLISCDFFLSLAFSFGTIALTDELSTMCFIQELRLALFYVILWIESLVIISLYVAVYLKVRAIARATDGYFGKVLSAGKSRIVLKAGFLSIGVAICWIPASASRIMSGMKVEVPFWLYLVQAITMPAHGLSDSLIFLFFAFGLSSQVENEDANVEDAGDAPAIGLRDRSERFKSLDENSM
ncbi:hypothetical protein HDU98_007230 [Podochytrium sp. JEL0797]|nr:hypothetical protein HDU98_007230 [Podochytrium sp. JEL0797]